MRHNRETHRFGRNFSERRAMLENMVSSLLSHQEITTTLQKAKAAKRLADKVITLGKKDTLHARRQVFAYLQNHDLTSKVFKEVAPRFKDRQGGYTRILQLQRRKGDGAQLALLELTEKEIKIKEVKKKKKSDEKSHKGHDHSKHEGGETTEKPTTGKEHGQKHTETKKGGEKQGPGFFRNIGKFFRNKGGS